jgi:hypothetical protein
MVKQGKTRLTKLHHACDNVASESSSLRATLQ